MTSPSTRSAEIREKLDHPIIDTDGHMMEHVPAFLQFLEQVGGIAAVDRFKARSHESRENSWHMMTPEERRRRRMPRAPFWQSPVANTRDRATAMLPGLQRARMDEFGFDFAIVYPTLGFYLIDETDTDVRRAGCRAHNAMTAELFGPHADRLAPASCIPTHTPEEAIEELEYAVNGLGHKAVMVCNLVHRPIEAARNAAPDIAHLATWTDALALDSEYDYDPFWARCRELGVAVTVHSRGQQRNARRSVTNYMNNQIGHFAGSRRYFRPGPVLRGRYVPVSRSQFRHPRRRRGLGLQFVCQARRCVGKAQSRSHRQPEPGQHRTRCHGTVFRRIRRRPFRGNPGAARR